MAHARRRKREARYPTFAYALEVHIQTTVPFYPIAQTRSSNFPLYRPYPVPVARDIQVPCTTRLIDSVEPCLSAEEQNRIEEPEPLESAFGTNVTIEPVTPPGTTPLQPTAEDALSVVSLLDLNVGHDGQQHQRVRRKKIYRRAITSCLEFLKSGITKTRKRYPI